AATNRLDIVDDALLRAGRFDFVLELPLPDAAARLEIFKVHTLGKPLAADVNLAALAATASEGCSRAEIELIARNASLAVLRRFVEPPAARPATREGFAVRAEHFHTAMRELGAERSKKPGREVAH